MTDYPGNLPPAGWYPDPYGAPYERWWDGAQWTEHTNIPAAPEPVAPVVEPAAAEPAAVEPVAAEPVAAEPVAAEPVAEQPSYQQPSYQQPVYQQPVYQQPEYTAPADSSPEPAPAAETFGAWSQSESAGTEPAFDDIFSSQPAAASEQPSYETPLVEQPTFAQAFEATRPSTGFDSLISGGQPAASTDFSREADPFDTWSNDGNLYIEPARNTAATVGATFGVLSFVIPALGGLIGLIFSVLGLRRAAQYKKEDGAAVGQRRSIAGIALSIIGTAVSLALVLFVLPGIINPATSANGGGSQTADGSSVVADAPLTANSNIALEQGAQGTITFPGTTDPSIQFAVTGITVDPSCTEDPELVLSPENGQFVAVTMDFTTAANYAESMTSGTPLQVALTDFVGLLSDGTSVANTVNGLSCIPEAEQLPAEIVAGQVTSGTIILDVTDTTSSFTYSPTGVTGVDPAVTRWEWAIPR